MPAFFEITIDNKALIKTFDPARFQRVFNKHASRQLLGFGAFVKTAITRYITDGKVIGQGLGVQQYLKGGDTRLLIHTGKFASAVKFKYVNPSGSVLGIDVGWISGQTASGYAYPKLAALMENGGEFTPTEAQRKAVAIKARRSGAPPPTGDRKAVWKIPPRPVLAPLMASKITEARFVTAAQRVITHTMREMMGGR